MSKANKRLEWRHVNKWIYRMLALLSSVTAVGAAQAKDLSIYISADMEGIAGVVSEQ